MKPLRDKASEGRANPKGIPYLYLATTKEAPMSEVRPWIGSDISVGQFKLISQLQFSGTVPMIDIQAYARWLAK